jgi:hypothetical protein
MSEGVAGRGRGRNGRNGEGCVTAYFTTQGSDFGVYKLTLISHTLLSSLGVNTSQLNHSIAQLPSDAQGDAPRNKRRRRPVAGGGSAAAGAAPAGHSTAGYGTSESDMHAWGRNWHEMVILGGIEAQRQKVCTISRWGKRREAHSIDDQIVPGATSATYASELGG